MSEYTPTTDEVREEFIYGHQELDMDGNVVVSFDEAQERWDRWLAKRDAELAAKAWDEGVTTALSYAKRQPDGITLKLETFDGDEWQNPYRKAVHS